MKNVIGWSILVLELALSLCVLPDVGSQGCDSDSDFNFIRLTIMMHLEILCDMLKRCQ